jgi:hypothetical protein
LLLYFTRALFVASYLLWNIFLGFLKKRFSLNLQNNEISLSIIYLFNLLCDKYKETLGFYIHNLFTKIYIFSRRFVYYLSISDMGQAPFNFFQEVNKSQLKERLAFYEPEHYNWRRSVALPLEIANIRFLAIKLLEIFYPAVSYLKLFFFNGSLGFMMSFFFIIRFILGFFLFPFYLIFLAMPRLNLLHEHFFLINQFYFLKSFSSFKSVIHGYAALFYMCLALIYKLFKIAFVYFEPLADFLNKIAYIFYYSFFFFSMHLLSFIFKLPIIIFWFFWKFIKYFGWILTIAIILVFGHEYVFWFFLTVGQVLMDHLEYKHIETFQNSMITFFEGDVLRYVNNQLCIMSTMQPGNTIYWKKSFFCLWNLRPPRYPWNWWNTFTAMIEIRSEIYYTHNFNMYHYGTKEWQFFELVMGLREHGPWALYNWSWDKYYPMMYKVYKLYFIYSLFIERPIYYMFYVWCRIDMLLTRLFGSLWENFREILYLYSQYYSLLASQLSSETVEFYYNAKALFVKNLNWLWYNSKSYMAIYWNLIFIETIPQYIETRDKLIFYYLTVKNIEFFFTTSDVLEQIHTAFWKYVHPMGYSTETTRVLTVVLLRFFYQVVNYAPSLNQWTMQNLIMQAWLVIRDYTDHYVDSFLLRWRVPKTYFYHPNYYGFYFHYTYKRLRPLPFYRSHQVETPWNTWNAHLFDYWTYFQVAYKVEGGRLHAPGCFNRFMRQNLIGHWVRATNREQSYFLDYIADCYIARILTYERISSTWERYCAPIYFIMVLSFLALSSSFRGLMLPRIFEGSSQRYWQEFRKESDQQWWDQLLLIPNVANQAGHTNLLADSNYLLGDQVYSFLNLSQLRKEKKDPGLDIASYASTALEDRRERKAMETLEKKQRKSELNKRVHLAAETQEFANYRKENLNLSYDLLFFRNPYLKSIILNKQSLDINNVKNSWKDLLAPNLQDSLHSEELAADFVSHYYDLKGLISFESLRYTYDSLPERTWRLLNALKNPSFNLQAALATFNYDYEEELRAEYLTQPWVMDNWIKFLDKTNSYFSTIDEKVFGNELGNYFLHKDDQIFRVTTENFSYLMQKPLLIATPQLFKRAKNKDPYYGYYPESLNLSIALAMWLCMLPVLIWIQGTIYEQDLEDGGMTKGERIFTEFLWNNRIVFLCYFESWQAFVVFGWHTIRFLSSPMRAGTTDVFEPPYAFLGGSEGVVNTKYFYTSYYYWANIYDTHIEKPFYVINNINFSLTIMGWAIFKVFAKILNYCVLFWILSKFFTKKRGNYIQFKSMGNFRLKSLSTVNLSNLLRYQKIKQVFTKGILYFWL